MQQNDTIVAVATPVGEGAIGVIRLSGPDSRKILSQIFRGKVLPENFQSHRLYFGKIIHEKEILDEVMAVWMEAPHSFTGEEVVEIQAHGGAYLLTRLTGLLTRLGARLAEPGEFSKRAFLNGKIDLSQAEAIADLIAAKNDWAAKNALSQLGGFLSQTITELRKKLISLVAELEAGFDFTEEDIQFFQKEKGLQLLYDIQNEIKNLLDSFETGQLYKEGLKIALVGKPNVGKSSLLNVLLNEDKAIIHHEPGTTRDVLEGSRKIDGIEVTFYDTAGIREAQNAVEAEGIKRSRQILEKADLILLVFDSSRPLDEEDQKLIAETASRSAIINIGNKSDLPPAWDSLVPGTTVNCGFIRVSAKNRLGITDLLEEISNMTIRKKLKNVHNYVLNNVRHKDVLNNISIKLKEVSSNLDRGEISEECLVEECRIIIKDLGQITGEITNEDVLDEVFSRFCIGK